MIEEKLLYESVGNEIRKLRKAKGYNQSDLAKKIGLERTSITNIEIGKQKATIFVIYKICELFDISIEHLLPNVVSVSTHDIDTDDDVIVRVGSKTLAAIERIKKG